MAWKWTIWPENGLYDAIPYTYTYIERCSKVNQKKKIIHYFFCVLQIQGNGLQQSISEDRMVFFSMKTYEHLRKSMKTYENLWKPMEIIENSNFVKFDADDPLEAEWPN